MNASLNHPVSGANGTGTRPETLDREAAELRRRGEELQRFAERFVRANNDDCLANVIAPFVTAIQASPARMWWNLRPPAPPLPRSRLRAEQRHSNRIGRRNPAQNARLYLAGEVLFEADGTNHWRTLEPIMRQFGEPRALAERPLTLARARLRKLTRTSLQLADQFIRGARKEGVWVALDPVRLARQFAAGARYLAYAETVLSVFRPGAVVTASTANVPPRALIHAARNAEIPSVYFPHAPAIADVAFADLPTDFAGLRGPRELEHYGEPAASNHRAEVVGNPSLPADPMPEHDQSLSPVIAPPLQPEMLVPVLELVRAGGIDSAVVSPHPRAELELITRMTPAGWTLWHHQTYDLLRKGPPLVLNYSSGLTIESLLLGIPTIDLRWPRDKPVPYPAIREPYVRLVSSGDEVRAAVSAARREIRDPERRAELRDWALGWSSPLGDEAAERSAEMVRRAAAGPPAAPIWDAWNRSL